jgi:hypothetical protein
LKIYEEDEQAIPIWTSVLMKLADAEHEFSLSPEIIGENSRLSPELFL